MRTSLCAPAKVNLGLRVVGRRPDGYHLLQTVMHTLDLHDVLALEDAADGVSLVVRGSSRGGFDVPADESNLVVRAARAFAAASGMRPAWRFELEKRIPAGGGLGGGSSDAAAALLLLQHRARAPLAPASLARLAASLGADVPFFLRGGTQLATGIGDVLEPVAHAPALHLLLIIPPFGTSTADVYRNYEAHLIPPERSGSIGRNNTLSSEELTLPPEDPRRRSCSDEYFNDLEATAMRMYPALGDIRARVIRAGYPGVRMTGSGSTLYLASPSRGEVAEAKEALEEVEEDGVRLELTSSASQEVDRREVGRGGGWEDGRGGAHRPAGGSHQRPPTGE
jgi:4-diphosphocytidyl-2-C-methyl-D-erythritol kinase